MDMFVNNQVHDLVMNLKLEFFFFWKTINLDGIFAA
jgi:hypothetical protein